MACGLRAALSLPLPSRYHRINHDPEGIARLFVELFAEAHRRPALRASPPRST
jgi:hypothetical protein